MLDFFTGFYGVLRNYKGFPFWLLTPLRRIVRCIANKILPIYLKHSIRGEPKIYTDIIVSFTSFPARINEVWQVVECMLRQTYLPKKMILWLSKEQFPSEELVPMSLKNMEGERFSIRFVDEDIRSHKKYYYVSCEYPDSLILLIDDDIYYPTDMIEKLVTVYKENPDMLVCRYGRKIVFGEDGCPIRYNLWENVIKESIDSQLFFGSGGGTLFKPSSLYRDLTNKNLFLKLTPIADDIWLNAMVRLVRLPVRMLKPCPILPIMGKGSKIALCRENVGLGRNDVQLAAVSEHYLNELGNSPFRRDYASIVDSTLC